jgi:hypothetical protein
MPTEHYKSEEDYRKSRAYVHLHGIKTHAKYVVVGGKRHKVKHAGKKKVEASRRKRFAKDNAAHKRTAQKG